MRILKGIVAAGLFATLTASAAMAQNSNVAVESAEQDRYIIVFNDSVGNPGNVAAALARQHGFSVRQTYTTALKGFAASLPQRAIDALSRDRRVKYIEADQLAHASAQTTPFGINRIFADTVSDTNDVTLIDGFDDLWVEVDVAVLDTGVAAHPDINLFARADCIGNPFNTHCDPDAGNDGNGHGTHVAGTIGGLDNDIGVVGVAPGARIWAIKVLKDNGSGWYSNIIGGVDYITTQGDIEVANMSLGGGSSTALCDAIRNSVVVGGITYAVAAGNDDADAAGSSPANCQVNPNGVDNAADGIITVSALADFNGLPDGGAAPTCRTDEDDTLANFSNWGSMVDIAAPGVCIESTWNDGGLNTISGTSMASPHVAGAAALLAASEVSPGVGYTPALIHSTLTNNGGDPLGWNDESGDVAQEPLLDVSAAVFNPVTVPGGGGGETPNASPTASISSPADTAEFLSNESISFSGVANDSEDGNLTASIAWTSSIDGAIGSGGSFSTTLGDGVHTITAEVTDSSSASGSDAVSITVGTPPPPPVGVTMYVANIVMGMKGKNLDTIITIYADTDGSNGISGPDSPVAGVVPRVELCDTITGGLCFFATATDVTNSGGQTKYKLLKPPSGHTYIMTVHDVTDDSGTFVFDEFFAGTDTSSAFDVP